MKTTDFSKVTIRGVHANAYIAMNAQGNLYTTVSTVSTLKRLIAVSNLQKNRVRRQAFLIHSASQQILSFSLWSMEVWLLNKFWLTNLFSVSFWVREWYL